MIEKDIKKIEIDPENGLDRISVYFENHNKGEGEVVIKCYDKSWNHYWGAMGDEDVKEFFLSSNTDYIASKLFKNNIKVEDWDKLYNMIKDHYKDDYEKGDFSGEVGELFEELAKNCDNSDWEIWMRDNHDVMSEVLGDDWFYKIPKELNPEYVYLSKIVDSVKEALS